MTTCAAISARRGCVAVMRLLTAGPGRERRNTLWLPAGRTRLSLPVSLEKRNRFVAAERIIETRPVSSLPHVLDFNGELRSAERTDNSDRTVVRKFIARARVESIASHRASKSTEPRRN